MAGIELATAYVSIVASAKGIRRDVASELRGVDSDATAAGKRAGAGMGAGIAAGVAAGANKGEGAAKAGGKRAGAGYAAGLVGSMRGLGSRFAGVLGPALAIGAGAVAVGLGKIVSSSVEAASNMQQSQGAVAAIFKSNAGEIERAAASAAQNVGISANEYRELSSVLGAQLKNKGITDFAAQTQNLITLGADMSAQFGGSTKEAVEALTSALRGETDPIERYGVSLNAAAVEAEALAMNSGATKKTLTDQQKAMAALSLITKQTADAQGTFARESDTLAGKQQRLSASVEDIKARIGTALIPTFERVAGFLNSTVIPAVNGFITEFEKGEGMGGAFKTALDGIVSAFQATVEFFNANSSWLTPILIAVAAAVVGIGALAAVFAVASGVAAVFGAAMAVLASPITGVVAVIAALIGAGVLLYQNWDTIKAKAAELWAAVVNDWNAGVEKIKAFASGVWNAIKGFWNAGVESIKTLTSGAWAAISGAWSAGVSRLKTFATTLWAVIKAAWSVGVATIKASTSAGWNAVVSTISGAMNRAKSAVSTAWNAVKSVTSAAWSAIRSVVSSALSNVSSAISGGMSRARSVVSSAMSAIRSLWVIGWNSLVSSVYTIVGRVAGAARGVMSAVRGAFSGAGSWLWDAGQRIVSGLINGLRSMFGSVRSTLGGLTNMIPSWKGPRERDSVLLTDAGQLIIGSLIEGFRSRYGDVRNDLAGLTDMIEGGITPSSRRIVPATSSAFAARSAAASTTTATNVPAVNITVHNPIAEPTSRTTNRALSTLALLGQIGGTL